jgi:glycosyltransferase involved in cell wall biosynthesis
VVIPTHNRRELALRAVDSIIGQEGAGSADVEVIVVDDGSTDGTSQAMHRRYADDPRVRVITIAQSYSNAARNIGFKAARGELLCFLDSDDFWTPRTFAVVEQVFARHPELAYLSIEGSTLPLGERPATERIVAGDAPGWLHAGFHKAPLVSEPFALDGESQQASLLYGDYFPAIINGDLFYLSGLVMRREAVAGAGPFTERFRFYNDWEFFARLCLQGTGAYLDYTGFQRDHGREDQISRGRPPTAMARRHLYILRSLPRRFPARVAAYASHLEDALDDAQYWMGRCLLDTPRQRSARRYLLRCVKRRYKPGRSLVRYARSLLAPTSQKTSAAFAS